MGLFGNLLKKPEIEIGAPVSGKCIRIQEVNDPTFAEEMLGAGIAIVLENGIIRAPEDGEITTAFPTGHAVGLTTGSGVELLIHIGLDTVQLNGQFFKLCVAEGAQVKKGDILIEADLDKIKEAGYDITSPIIICNTSDYKEIKKTDPCQVKEQDIIFRLVK